MSEAGATHPHTFHIIVNTRPKDWNEPTISFEQLIALAFANPPSGPTVEFTITYSQGESPKHEGTLQPGQSVNVRDGMIFDVTATDKS
jgi:hypothetical protein